LTQHLFGWLLDIYIEKSKAILWIKSEDGRIVRLTDKYTPSFYVESDDPAEIERLAAILSNHPNIEGVEKERKSISLSAQRSNVAHIYADSILGLKKVLSDLANVDGIKAVYNVDLLHVQWYVFQKGVPPTSKVYLTLNDKNELACIEAVDDSSEIPPPPFKILFFDLKVSNEIFPKANADPISGIEVLDENQEVLRSFVGAKKEVLPAFERYVETEDPDFLIASKIREKLAYIVERCRSLGLNLQLGREVVDVSLLKRLFPYCHKGRVTIDLGTFLLTGIPGIVERARFALIPPGLAAKLSAGRVVDSRQCYQAFRRGILIPKSAKSFDGHTRTAKETVLSNRGGLILSPKVGLHENVGALDFESMYPQIIIKHNESYETTTPTCITTERKGFLSQLTETFLQRRLYFKHLCRRFPKDSSERTWCEQR